MNKQSRLLIILIVFFHFVFMASGQQTAISPELRRAIQQRVDSAIYESVVIGVVKKENTEIMQLNSKSTKDDMQLTSDKIFKMDFLKPIIICLQLADMLSKEMLTIDQSLNDALPKEFHLKKPGKVNIKNLALNNSGISVFDEILVSDICPNNNEVFGKLEKASFDYAAGSSFDLSNFQYDLLSVILLEKMGLPCEVYFNDELFSLLSLRNTFLSNGESPPVSGQGCESGKLFTSVEELMKIIRIENAQIKKEFATILSVLQKYRQETRFKSLEISPGWLVYQQNSNDYYIQSGSHEDFSVFIAFCPEQQFGLVILAKSKFSVIDLGWSLLLSNTSYLNQRVFDLTKSGAGKFCGEYINQFDELVSIIKKGDNLLAYFNGRESYLLYKVDDKSWTLPVPGYTFRFIDDTGIITELLIEGYSEEAYIKIK